MTMRLVSIGVLLIVGSIGLTPFTVQAAVAFNTFPLDSSDFTPRTNRDLPFLDARNVTKSGNFSSNEADHDNGVSVDPGDVIEFRIYYHNSGTPEDIAHNVIVKASLPGGSRLAHEVSASIDSDETAPVSGADAFRGGNITINITGSQTRTLDLIAGSTRHFPEGSPTGLVLSDGNSIAASGVNLGSIKGCFEFAGFVTFRAQVGQGVVTVTDVRDLSIEKQVLNITRGDTQFRNSTNAQPGDRAKFEIRVQTSGNAAQSNVIVRDILPAKLNRISETTRLDGVLMSGESDFFGGGRNIGTLSAGTVRIITFEANVAGSGVFSGIETLTNTANVRSDQVATRQDTANIVVQPSGETQFVQSKSAFNLTQGVDATTVAASPGDVITYTLRFRNAGNTTITNHVIEDNIHDILELARITNLGGAVSVNSTIRYSPVTVAPGVEIVRIFQVTVRPVSEFPAATDLLMTNIFGNEVRVPVRRPQVAGVVTPPRTGVSAWLIFGLAGATTFIYLGLNKRFFVSGP